MFYLKYRPQTISQIDNSAVRENLKAVIETRNIPHALLFSGPKGTGKTSAARIVAKTINCETNAYAQKSADFAPCNQCSNCRTITTGTALDVVELDAASNRKVEDMRELIEKIHFSPVHCRFKVYIIDEVHMLTKESFNTLLKTLEEPPPQLIFILATTEKDKLPKTIQSRCLQFNFQKASDTDLVLMLERIAKAEKIAIDKEALALIAAHADNSFRDAAKILEQAVLQNDLTADGINSVVGLQKGEDVLLELIADKKQSELFKLLEKYEKDGGNFKALIESQLQKLHRLLLAENGVASEPIGRYNLTMPQITRLIKLMQEAYNLLSTSPIESLPLEMAIVEYCNSTV